MLPATGANPFRRDSRVCDVLTRASATRSAETAESRFACVPEPVLLSDAARMVTGSVVDFDQTVHGPYGAHAAPAAAEAAAA